jgi:hypothetical protein
VTTSLCPAGTAMPWLYRAKGREIEDGERARKSKSLGKGLPDARPAQRFRHRKICEGGWRATSMILHPLPMKKALPERQRIARIKML